MKRHFLLVFVFSILLSLNLNAQSEELIEPIQPSDLFVGTTRTFEDPSFGDPNSVVENPAIEVRIGILDDVVINPSIWFTYEIQLKISTINLITQTINPATEEVLKIEYSPFGNVGNFEDLDLIRYNNAQGLQIDVIGITIIDRNTGDPLNISTPENVYLELKFTSNRYRRLSTVLPNITTKLYNYNESGDFEISNSSAAKEVEFNWEPITGAKYYDLEWTWVDSYPENISAPSLASGQIDLDVRTFENNSSRIRTTNTSYRLPLIYAKGFLVYRVRAIGFRADDYSGGNNFVNTSKLFYGEWTSNPDEENPRVSDWNGKLLTYSHEKNKNWQFQASFAEDGKKKEVVSYFDGTLRNRQTVTKINTDNSAIVGEVIYDNQGRPAVEVLPAPAEISALKYHEKFNINLFDNIYTHYDFDWSDPNSVDCDLGVSTGGMSDASGSSMYYSDKLNLKTEPKDYFIPFANNYPFSQIQYTDDNTGRIKRKSGVGDQHQLGSGHEMKYYYLTPNQPELNRLFGYKVGFDKFYKKNTVIDPNGQISISYIDPQGRTIATALSGNAPKNLEALPEAVSNPLLMDKIDLLSKIDYNATDIDIDKNDRISTGVFGAFFDGLEYSGNHFAINDNDQFILSYKAQMSDVLLCDTYYPFVYDLHLSILNECGDEIPTDLTEEGITPTSVINTTIGTNSPSSSAQIETYSKEITTTEGLLIQGNHTISKTITVNEAAFNNYLGDYMASDCILPPAYFQLHLLDDSCEVTEQDCITLRGFSSANEYALAEINIINQHLTSNNLPILTPPIEDDDINEYTQYIEAFEDIYLNKLDACDLLDVLTAEDDSGTNTYTDNCDIATLRLLQDFKPGDQYAIYEVEDHLGNVEAVEDQFSIFYGCNNVNDVTCTNTNNSYLPAYGVDNLELPLWKHPKDLSGAASIYYNDASLEEEAYVDVKVEVDENGEFVTSDEDFIFSLELDEEFAQLYYDGSIPRVDEENYLIDSALKKVKPHHLANEEDFIAAWNDDWAHSLLFYHPEVGYSSYFKAICVNTYDNPSYPSPLSSTAFDDYIKSLNAVDLLANGNLDQILDEPLALLELDPFFNLTYSVEQDIFNDITTIDGNTGPGNIIDIPTPDGVTTYSINNELEARNALMKYALEHDIDGLGLPMWQHVYRLYTCGDIVLFECNAPDSLSDLMNDLNTDEEKEAYWAAYRATYLSMKEKVMYIFSNIFAKQNGFSNGCIENLTSNPLLVIDTYPNVLVSAIDWYWSATSNPSNDVCFNTPVSNQYNSKSRRYLPFDVVLGEDAGNPDALNNLVDSNDYDYWQFTGLCPTAVDMLYFVKGFFADINKDDGIFPEDNATAYDNVQYLTQDLYTALGGTVIIEDDTQPILGPTNGIKIYTNGASVASSGDLTIRIADSDDRDGITNNGADETSFISINDTDSDNINYDWGSYGSGNNQWSIIDVLDIVYTGISQGQQTFTFLAIVSSNGDPDARKEVVFSGASHANIGNCGTDTSQVGDDYDFIPVLGECEIKHIGMTILAPDKDDHWSPNHSTHYTDSPVNQGQRHAITQGVADFMDTISQDNVLFSSFHDAQSSPFIAGSLQRNLTSFIDGHDSYLMNLTGERKRQPQVDVTLLDAHGGYAIQIQNDNYNNTFKNIIDKIPIVITEPIDVMYIILLADKVYNLNEQIQSYNSFKNNPLIKKVFFIIPRIPSDVVPPISNRNAYFEDIDNWDAFEHNWSPYEFIELLIGDIPIEYNGVTNTTLNSDFMTFNLTDLNGGLSLAHDDDAPEPPAIPSVHDFPELTNFLINSYSEVFETPTEVASSDPCNPCTPIIPPTTSCNEAWDIYENGLGLDNGLGIDDERYSTLIDGLLLNDYDWLTEEKFCELNYKYSIEHYEEYVTDVMNVLDPINLGINNAFYIDFPNFTGHALGYGHPSTSDAIQEYANYLLDFPEYLANHTAMINGDPLPYPDPYTDPDTGNDNYISVPLNFLNYVAEEYIDDSGVCPRAMLRIDTPEIIVESDCESFLTNIQNTYQNDLYEQYLEEQREYFRNEYLNASMNSLVENLDLSYDDKEYQYTLYYYDQAGNLMQTVPPKGVDRLEDPNHDQINQLRDNDGISDNTSVNPKHELRTRYKYNSLNQLVYQNTPDGGETRFAYDALGRIVMSQNAKQAIPVDGFFQEVIEYPTFVNALNVTTPGNDVVKSVSGVTEAGASSLELIYDNGYVEWELLEPDNYNKAVAAGLSYVDENTTAEDIDFRFFQGYKISKNLFVYNDNGGTPFNVGPWAVGQKLRVERGGGTIKFYINNVPIHSKEDIYPNMPLRFDCALTRAEPNAVRNVKIVNTWKVLESFSYTSYDELGRIREAGQLKVPNDLYQINDEGRLINTITDALVVQVNDDLEFPDNISEVREEVTLTTYDEQHITTNLLPVFENYNKYNNRNRVTAVLYFENLPVPFDIYNYNNGLFYSYDIHGNVKELVTDIKDSRLQMMGQNLKKVSYEYDLISGNVNKVSYQKSYKDQFIHQYFYDADNRITGVKTSRDGIIWENEAEYDYYKHGPLARVLIGDKKVQALDYAYTIQGWLKGINSEKIDAEDDIGNDGYYGDNFKVAKDAFGFSLRYYNNDYQSNEENRLSNLSGFMDISSRELYNGNIKQMVTSLRGLNEEKLSSLSNLYTYDQLNRLSSSYNQTIKELNSNSAFDTNNAGYDTEYTYDKNGNIKTLHRDAFGEKMDRFEDYALNDHTNQLRYIKETVGPDNFELDIDPMGDGNYLYDAIGQLIVDNFEELKINWTVTGKVKDIGGSKDIKFTYDGLGNRQSKIETKKEGNTITTYYLRDAQGNPLAVNNLNSFPSNNFVNWNTTYAMKEHNIYGSSRLGLQEYSIKRKEDLLASLNYTDEELKKFRSSQQPNNINQNNPLLCENCAYSFNDNNSGIINDDLIDINLNTTNTFNLNTIITPLNNFAVNQEKIIFYLSDSPSANPNQGFQKVFLNLTKNGSVNTGFKYIPTLKLANVQFGTSTLKTCEITNTSDLSISSLGDLQDIYYSVTVTALNQYEIYLYLNGATFSTEDGSLTINDVPSPTAFIDDSRVLSHNFKMCNLMYDFDTVGRSFDFTEVGVSPTETYFSNEATLTLSNLNTTEWIPGACGEDNDDDDDTVLNDQEDLNGNGDLSDDDTDGDGIPNYQDEDDDGDGILTINEDADLNGSVLNDHSDTDGILNYLDDDDDGDSVKTRIEIGNPDLGVYINPWDAPDFDGDEIKNYLDIDDDDDTVLTLDEYNDGEDFDLDGHKNYLDIDDDADTVPTAFENTFPGGDQAVYLLDTDGDGDYNFLDIDDDNDGYITKEEDDNLNNDPTDDDEDGDGHPDFLDSEDLNPNIPGDISKTFHYNLVGDKRYELSNHLGNVVSVITDRKLPAFNIGKEWYGSKSFKDYWNEYGKSSIYVDNNTLFVKCGDKFSGAYGKYEFDSGLTYSVQMDIGKENFMANLVFDILDPSGNTVYTQTVTESTTIGTQFTATQGGTYVLLIYVDESFTQPEEFTISNLIIADVTSIAHDTNQVDIFGTFVPDIVAYNDYYPFGMLMPNRHDTAGDYRYGFNGMEKDDEIKGEGNSYDYGARMLDSRIGRWFAVDKKASKLPNQTPYNYVKNAPLRFIDPDGNFNIDVHKRITSNAFAKSKRLQTTKNYQVLEDYRRGVVGYGIFDGGVVAPDTRYIKSLIPGGFFGSPSVHEEHFDEMDYQQIITNFDRVNTGIRQIVDKYQKGDVNELELGQGVGEFFHAVQDFYSHSNFIELYEEVYGQTDISEIPTLQEALTSDDHTKFANLLKDKLITGETTNDEGEGSHKEMNHDLGDDGSVWKKITPGTRGKDPNWNSKAAEAVATKATLELNDEVESKLKAND